MFPFNSRRSKKKNSKTAVAVNPLGYDFAVLGLSSRECRTGIIRKAADRAVEQAQSVATDGKERSELTAQVIMSTYRLLDPRNRSHPQERIQLSIFSEDDWERQRSSRRLLLERPPLQRSPLVRAELVDKPLQQVC
ncbi:MAG: hypothetical protein AB8B50_05705 [Pirellulaceae bacterium]